MRDGQSQRHVGWYGKSHMVFVPQYRRHGVWRERHCTGLYCWARGYGVSPVGLGEQVIRDYIRDREQEDKRQEELQGLEPLSKKA